VHETDSRAARRAAIVQRASTGGERDDAGQVIMTTTITMMNATMYSVHKRTSTPMRNVEPVGYDGTARGSEASVVMGDLEG